VHGHATATGDEADDLVSRHRRSTDRRTRIVVETFDDTGRAAERRGPAGLSTLDDIAHVAVAVRAGHLLRD
jgi:hypothetical protein